MMMLSTGLSDEQVRSDLEECPRWVIYKLKESINVKQTIEREWEEAKQDLARCKQDLVKKFQMAVQKQEEKQMELERVERELLKKKLELEHKEFDIQMWKDSSEKYAVQESKLKEEKMMEQKMRLKILEEEIDKLAQELAQKDLQLLKLQDRLSEVRAASSLETERLSTSESELEEVQSELAQVHSKLSVSESLRAESDSKLIVAEIRIAEIETRAADVESENERLIAQIERLESELEMKISSSGNTDELELALEEFDRENTELKRTIHEQAEQLAEMAQRMMEMKDAKEGSKKEVELQARYDAVVRMSQEESRRSASKVSQLEEELALQRLTELELKELMEGIEKEAKRLNDEVWLKDNEIDRLREDKERMKMELDRAHRNVLQLQSASRSPESVEAAKRDRAASAAPKKTPTNAGYSERNGTEDEELLQVIAMGNRESWRPNIKAKSCKLAWLDANAKMDVLSRILLKDDLILVNGIRAVVEPEEEASVAMALLHIFVADNKDSLLLRNFIRKEVQQAEQFSDVFKSNTLASKIISGYSSLVGEIYLQAALKPILSDFIALNQSFELEQGNRYAIQPLVETVRKILQAIRSSLAQCPRQLFDLASILWHEVGKKFTDEERYKAVAIWIFARFFAPAIFSPPDSFAFGEINKESARGLVLISRVIQNIAHGNSFKEKRLADMNTLATDIWLTMKQFADTIRKGGDSDKSTIFPKMTTGEAVKTLVYVMGSKKSALINSLKHQNASAVTDTYIFKTAERLISACVSVGVPHAGLKLDIKENDSAVEDFSNVITEKPRVLAELAPAALKMNEGDKLAQSIVIMCHCRNRDEAIPEFIKEFLLRDMSANPKDPKYQHDGMASRTFLPYANLIGTDFITKMLTPLLQYCTNDIKEDLKPSTPALLEAVAKFTMQIVSFIAQLPFSLWDICTFIHTKGRIKGPGLVVAFLFLRFFCPAIKNPEAYCFLSQPLSAKIKKHLAVVADSLAKVAPTTGNATPSPNLNLSSDPLSVLLKNEKDKIFNAVDNWLVKPSVVPQVKQSEAPFPWTIHEEAIRYLHQLVFDNISTLAYKLGEDTAASTMTYQMPEIVDVIVATLAP